MLYCPKCKAEYREGFKVCIDCHVPLVTRSADNGEGEEKSAQQVLNEAERERKYEQLMEKADELYEAERFREALKVLNEASQINQDDSEVWSMLGLVYDALGRTREAWRSFKLALNADPNDTNALWCAAEFLYEREDYPLAMRLIERYLEVETDPDERKDAEALKEEIAYHLGSVALGTQSAEADELHGEPDSDEEIPEEGFTVLDAFEDEEDEEITEEEEEEWEEEEELEEEELDFMADLSLHLTDRNSKCIFCGVALPTDAPFCYNCKEPHLYEPL